ncbi:hypothetical protein BCF53_102220 [Reinekea marinisedimentorum]|uniref:SH3 domain-containing protein n=2 Tax=Reinekea marinisedimentorum TaxID=230495 RepID=A0A4R3IB36_9GAMM|nr:hypothetical protein BCF53_102220 [Reinekea marinisedimentorum]
MIDSPVEQQSQAFWETSADATQAAVHLALHWLAYVYPASELQIEKTLKTVLPSADSDLASRASHFFDQASIEQHVQALEWVAESLTEDQVPLLVETGWRLLLADHQLPAHVPLALRILGRVLNIAEADVLEIGGQVFEELTEADSGKIRVPLLPVEPRYLDRIEWRLHGTAEGRMVPDPPVSRRQRRYQHLLLGFALGTVFGALLAIALIFGPLQLGRVKVPVLLHDFSGPAIVEPVDVDSGVPVVIEIEPVTSDAEQITAEESPLTDAAATEPPESGSTQTTQDEGIVITPIVELDSIAQPALGESAAPVITTSGERQLMEVTASILNVRESASVDAPVLIKLGEGARVWAYPETEADSWIQVQVDGQIGFASARFLAEVTP